MKLIVTIVIVIIPFIQTTFCSNIKLPDNNFIQGWQKSGIQQTYYKNDLYGHINGGAELFLEFGFDSLLVQDYNNHDAELSLEVYCMDNPEAALGIYLMKCGQETPSSKINTRNSTNKFQIIAVKSNLYIQLNNFKSNENSGKAMSVLLNSFLLEISDSGSIKLLNILPDKNKIPGSEKIIRGQYALQPIYTFGEGDILQLNGKIYGATANYETEDDVKFTQIVIPYPDKNISKEVLDNLIINLDPYLIVIEKNDSGFIFRDYKKRYGLVKILSEILFISIHLESKPAL